MTQTKVSAPRHYEKMYGTLPRRVLPMVHQFECHSGIETDRQVIWHDASRSQWQEYALHIFPSGTESMGDRGSKKA